MAMHARSNTNILNELPYTYNPNAKNTPFMAGSDPGFLKGGDGDGGGGWGSGSPKRQDRRHFQTDKQG